METAEKIRENRLRRVADRRGMVLRKSPRRDPNALGHGLYALCNGYTGNLINIPLRAGPVRGDGWYHATLDEIEAFLGKPRRREQEQGQREAGAVAA